MVPTEKQGGGGRIRSQIFQVLPQIHKMCEYLKGSEYLCKSLFVGFICNLELDECSYSCMCSAQDEHKHLSEVNVLSRGPVMHEDICYSKPTSKPRHQP